MMTDPVCGMEVSSKTAPTSTFQGRKYVFCSDECKEQFDSEPEVYTQSAETPMHERA